MTDMPFYVRDKVFAIDFDEKSVRVSRCLNLIAGDGETNVLHLNTLDWTKWDETVKQDEWSDTYGDGWRRLRKQRANPRQADYRSFGYDVLMANPPFAGDINPDYSPRSVGGCGMRVIQCCLWAKARASRSRYRVL